MTGLLGRAFRAPLLGPADQLALVRRAQRGDREAAGLLVERNLKFIQRRVFRWARRPDEDLLAEGMAAVLDAIRTFRFDKGVQFLTHATHWIDHHVRERIMRDAALVRLGTTQAQRAEFWQRGGAGPAMQARMLAPVPLDELYGAAASTDETPEELYAAAEYRHSAGRQLAELLQGLDPREREIVEIRLLQDERYTLEEIGETMGCSRERIRQLQVRAVRKILRAAGSENLDAVMELTADKEARTMKCDRGHTKTKDELGRHRCEECRLERRSELMKLRGKDLPADDFTEKLKADDEPAPLVEHRVATCEKCRRPFTCSKLPPPDRCKTCARVPAVTRVKSDLLAEADAWRHQGEELRARLQRRLSEIEDEAKAIDATLSSLGVRRCARCQRPTTAQTCASCVDELGRAHAAAVKQLPSAAPRSEPGDNQEVA